MQNYLPRRFADEMAGMKLGIGFADADKVTLDFVLVKQRGGDRFEETRGQRELQFEKVFEVWDSVFPPKRRRFENW